MFIYTSSRDNHGLIVVVLDYVEVVNRDSNTEEEDTESVVCRRQEALAAGQLLSQVCLLSEVTLN